MLFNRIGRDTLRSPEEIDDHKFFFETIARMEGYDLNSKLGRLSTLSDIISSYNRQQIAKKQQGIAVNEVLKISAIESAYKDAFGIELYSDTAMIAGYFNRERSKGFLEVNSAEFEYILGVSIEKEA